MARKERNDVDYFPHSVSHGKKMFYIRSTYGNDGYAVWFMLLENLGKASYHYLDLSDDIELKYLSSEFKVSEILLKDIINSLVLFGEFDAELWQENSILFNHKFIDNISDAYKKRNNSCVTKKSLVTLLITKGILKPSKGIPNEPKGILEVPRNTQRIEEETKEEETKENSEDVLISNYDISQCILRQDHPERETLEIAILVFKIFKKNSSNRALDEISLKDWVVPIRKLTGRKYTRDNFLEILNFIFNHEADDYANNGGFWKPHVLDSASLEKQFEKIKAKAIHSHQKEIAHEQRKN